MIPSNKLCNNMHEKALLLCLLRLNKTIYGQSYLLENGDCVFLMFAGLVHLMGHGY